jgi:hypothetical protein
MSLAIWSHGDKTDLWQHGTIQHFGSIPDALAAARGVTAFASEIVPSLLLNLGQMPTERALVADESSLAGFGPPECGKCRLVAIGMVERRRQHVLTIDENTAEIRRVQSFSVFRHDVGENGKPEDVESETLLVYDSEFDPKDEDSLLHEVDAQPW